MIPVLPESAPFTPAQRAWLNGFFAGLLGLNAPAAPLQAPGPNLEPGAWSLEPASDDYPWHDPTLPLAERMQLAEGQPRPMLLMAAMAQQDCGSCGYLCRTYAEAIADGSETDLTKCVPGGRATAKKLKEIVAEGQPVARSPQPAAVAGVRSPAPRLNGSSTAGCALRAASYDRQNPYPAAVLEVRRLNAERSEKEVRHVAFDLSGSDLRYEVGDALGVYPENCPELVDGILGALGATGEESVTTRNGRELAAREALTCAAVINRGSEEVLELLGRWARDAGEAERLRQLIAGDPDDFLEGRDLLDLLEEFPSARGPVAELASVLSLLQPRLYSIASSPKVHPAEVHLTVGVVRARRPGSRRMRKGVASTFLAERASSGRRVGVFVQPSHGFRLPKDSSATPIVMVGPGTGIAPFRAFLQELSLSGARGKQWLFFGDQRREYDFLYRDELEAYCRSGVLTRLDLAFSRDQPEKIYVQHRMRENARELWTWLQEGAHFYVCGDATRMARDVDATLRQIAAEQGRMSAEEARAYVTGLQRAGRYQRDVY
jgi:sulfite reductase (NADPH) flavoprotein alpha-component